MLWKQFLLNAIFFICNIVPCLIVFRLYAKIKSFFMLFLLSSQRKTIAGNPACC